MIKAPLENNKIYNLYTLSTNLSLSLTYSCYFQLQLTVSIFPNFLQLTRSFGIYISPHKNWFWWDNILNGLSSINYTIHTIVGSFLDNKIFRLTGQQALERHALRIWNFSEYLVFFYIKVIILEMKAVISNYLNVMWMILRACKYDLLTDHPPPSSLGWRKILGLSQLWSVYFSIFLQYSLHVIV